MARMCKPMHFYQNSLWRFLLKKPGHPLKNDILESLNVNFCNIW